MTAGRPNYNRIKVMLAARGISNEELAHHLGMTPTSVANWCTNRIQPSVITIFQIAEFLECDAGDLLTPRKDFKLLAEKVKHKVRSSPAIKTARAGKRPSKPER